MSEDRERVEHAADDPDVEGHSLSSAAEDAETDDDAEVEGHMRVEHRIEHRVEHGPEL
jgi:hypothetical protein